MTDPYLTISHLLRAYGYEVLDPIFQLSAMTIWMKKHRGPTLVHASAGGEQFLLNKLMKKRSKTYE